MPSEAIKSRRQSLASRCGLSLAKISMYVSPGFVFVPLGRAGDISAFLCTLECKASQH